MVDTGISNTCMLWGTFFKDSSLHEGCGLQQLLVASCPDLAEPVLVYTPSWWKMNASRSLNIPSHVHVPGCAHAEAQEKRQHAKTGFGEPNRGWFQTKCVGQRQCATRCMQNSRRANPVSSRLSHHGID